MCTLSCSLFLTIHSLSTPYLAYHLHSSVLRPGGILAINVVARTSSLLEQLVLDIKIAFADGEAEEEKQMLHTISSNLSTSSSVLGSDSMSSGAVSVSGKREQCSGQRSQVHLLKVSELTANTTLLVVKGTIGRACTEKEKEKNRVDSVKTNGTKKKPSSHSDFSPSASASPSASSLKSAREDAIEEWLKVGIQSNFIYQRVHISPCLPLSVCLPVCPFPLALARWHCPSLLLHFLRTCASFISCHLMCPIKCVL